MEIILREDIDNLGTRGQVVKVTPGYARKYLLPRRLAVAATDSNRKIVEQERQAYLRKEAVLKTESDELAKLVNAVTITIARKAGENGQLFGSVTTGDIADALTAQKFNIDRRQIHLDEAIRTLGEYKVPVKLHREVTTEVSVSVVAGKRNFEVSLLLPPGRLRKSEDRAVTFMDSDLDIRLQTYLAAVELPVPTDPRVYADAMSSSAAAATAASAGIIGGHTRVLRPEPVPSFVPPGQNELDFLIAGKTNDHPASEADQQGPEDSAPKARLPLPPGRDSLDNLVKGAAGVRAIKAQNG